jgi:hypothetical protein
VELYVVLLENGRQGLELRSNSVRTCTLTQDHPEITLLLYVTTVYRGSVIVLFLSRQWRKQMRDVTYKAYETSLVGCARTKQ